MTYIINGKKIDASVGALAICIQLLEALSDKEECKQLCLNCFNKGKGLKEDITLGLSECDYCKEVEQPTSLKEEIWDNIDRGLQYYQYRPDGNNIPRTEYSKTLTEQTIKLIQSNLIKEIDKLNPEYATMATNLGYSDAKKDIIKIINNIK